MHIRRLWLKDFRSYEELEISISERTCVVSGSNGEGKSNLLEAICYAGRLESFRNAPADALIRRGCDSAVVRAEFLHEGRETLVEAEIARAGKNRVLVNRQRLARTADLISKVLVTVFSPADLELVKGGPSLRRSFLDQLLESLDPRNEAVRSDFERSLKQRNALLKQTRGRLDASAEMTLEVWNAKLTESGETLAELRSDLVDKLIPLVREAYSDIAGTPADVLLEYLAPWRAVGLEKALGASRDDDLRRGVTLVGPHRDDVAVALESMPTRTHASQGEQRTMALALRLAGHRLLSDTYSSPPILLLDDVFSELDHARSEALLASLPPGQRILSTATDVPTGVHVDQVLVVSDGAVHEATA